MKIKLRPGRARNGGSDGFNLVILVVSITVLNIMLSLALPAWSTMIQREKEQELIFRGLQYAEAIRVFQTRNGRLPNQITELIEVEPRAIRQLWHNPMMDDGSWILIPPTGQQAGGQAGPQGGRPPGGQQGGNNGRPVQRADRQPQALRVVPPRPGELSFTPLPSGPFTGVASPEGGEAVVSFLGSREMSEWRFTVELVSAMQQSPDLSFARPVHSGMFWRPFPPGVTPPNLGGQPGQGGQPGAGGLRPGGPGGQGGRPSAGGPGKQKN